MNNKRRTTLKVFGAALVGGVSTSVAAFGSLGKQGKNLLTRSHDVGEAVNLTGIEISARESASSKDIELVLTNNSSQAVQLNRLTPNSINTLQGRFDLSDAMQSRHQKLAVGESIAMPLQRHTNVKQSSLAKLDSKTLVQSVREQLKIVDNDASYAALSILPVTAAA